MKLAYRPSKPEQIKWSEIKGNSRNEAFEFVTEDQWLYDSDNSGGHTGYFAVELDGQVCYFKFKQDWWWEDWDNENRYLENTFLFTEIDNAEAKIPSNRDWLDVTQYSFPETKKWPPENAR